MRAAKEEAKREEEKKEERKKRGMRFKFIGYVMAHSRDLVCGRFH
jgi:hypothetical protein